MKRKRDYTSKAKIQIDPHKHDDQIRELEAKHYETDEVVTVEGQAVETEGSSEEEMDIVSSDTHSDIGRIDISFPEAFSDHCHSRLCYPLSYYILSPKERLLLLYAENFRHQFFTSNLKTRPLVLALPNECNIQKFVCTTLRPTSFLYKSLRNAAGIASFVADYVIYEPFDDNIRFELKQRDADRFLYRKPHAWVALFRSGAKDQSIEQNDVEDGTDRTIEVDFVEPSTGFFLSSSCMDYTLINSAWNQKQYYVNKQVYVRVGEIRWNLQNTDDWEHLLPGENEAGTSIDNASEIMNEKYLNTIPSWVSKLHLNEKEYEERFPNLQKTVFYKRVKHLRFSPYFNKDGKMMQLTLFADDEYTVPIFDCIHFENRADMLLRIEKNYKMLSIKEIFGKSRKDNLLKIVRSMDPNRPKELYFSANVRRDSMEYLRVETGRIIVKSKDRRDMCFYQEFEFKMGGDELKKITQRFKRNYSIPSWKDIAERTFQLMQQRIHLKFHYSPGALTASTCEISKPPKPDYGQEIIYDKALTRTFKANNEVPEPLQLEMYRLIMDQLQSEDMAKKSFKKLSDEIIAILDNRRNEMEHPILQFRLFDSMRNGAARSKCLKEVLEEGNEQDHSQHKNDIC
ncbi:coiled-coil domain-containing protein lobo isoform X2 [Musca domestica]|uniref:Coiled-coil domain-containing protein lobo isoform X2 n=1 Tax=Musca domestica TaxID=7370 RepID=A0ABM3VBR2_MUSDO|nr:coiled-coil domain-containing protein lobo isoform X2 [Musca domestica]